MASPGGQEICVREPRKIGRLFEPCFPLVSGYITGVRTFRAALRHRTDVTGAQMHNHTVELLGWGLLGDPELWSWTTTI